MASRRENLTFQRLHLSASPHLRDHSRADARANATDQMGQNGARNGLPSSAASHLSSPRKAMSPRSGANRRASHPELTESTLVRFVLCPLSRERWHGHRLNRPQVRIPARTSELAIVARSRASHSQLFFRGPVSRPRTMSTRKGGLMRTWLRFREAGRPCVGSACPGSALTFGRRLVHDVAVVEPHCTHSPMRSGHASGIVRPECLRGQSELASDRRSHPARISAQPF